ncbi:protein prenyltransferase alpha subunit repeat-containing protein [Anaeramoeba flamelloides]|uniref:Protein prenyltransferase alpha subunit repeat-containing protein n=1 Tax=Anaeramoeba flamelloides TaxID=1746091 RepID=A0AAV8AC32_9EUKA|nr:protein prenyltransferase alpha subunit repeat-containing protein [Anaeramoeba flamelloides]
MEGERIYTKLQQIFNSGQKIKEFGVIFEHVSVNSEYYPLFFEEGNLGVHYQNILSLLQFSLCLFNQRSTLSEKEILILTKILLLVNPGFVTALNKRRTYLYNGSINPEKELDYLDILLARHPKIQELWIYRFDILEEYFKQNKNQINNINNKNPNNNNNNKKENNNVNSNSNSSSNNNNKEENNNNKNNKEINERLEKEFSICSKCADIYPRNYYAWTYRIKLWKHLSDPLSLLLEELNVTMKQFVKKHLSDYSALNYRQFLLKEIETQLKKKKKKKKKKNNKMKYWICISKNYYLFRICNQITLGLSRLGNTGNLFSNL